MCCIVLQYVHNNMYNGIILDLYCIGLYSVAVYFTWWWSAKYYCVLMLVYVELMLMVG